MAGTKIMAMMAGLGLVGIGLAGCGSSAATTSVTKKPLVGFVEVTQSASYYVGLRNAIATEAHKLGYPFTYVDAHNSVSKENTAVMDLLTKGMKCLIIDAVNPKAVAPALAAAKRDHVPVVAVDRPVSVPVTTFVGRNNAQMGHLVGEYVKNVLLKGRKHVEIYELLGSAGDLVMMARRSGFDSVFAHDPNVTIRFSSYDNYERAKAIVSMTDFLAKPRPNLAVVYAENDSMALGALGVLQSHHLSKVDVVGIDGNMHAIKGIMNGGQYKATALNDPAYQGTVAMEVAQKLLDGKKVPSFVNVGTKLVTIFNASTFYNPNLAYASYKPVVHF